MSAPSVQILAFRYPPMKETRDPWRSLIPGLGKEKFKMILEHLVVQKQENV